LLVAARQVFRRFLAAMASFHDAASRAHFALRHGKPRASVDDHDRGSALALFQP
jgi:hypothetical protein